MSIPEEKKNLTTGEAAKALGVCPQRIQAKLSSGHFPNAFLCECGRSTLIPRTDLKQSGFIKRVRKVGKKK